MREGARRGGPASAASRAALAHYIQALADAGWAKSAMAEPLGVTRQEVHRLSRQAEALPRPATLPAVPALPAKPTTSARTARRESPKITASEAKRLRELAPLATKVRGVTAEHDPARTASVEYSVLLAELWKRGVSRQELARITGQAPATIRARLARHGHINRGASERPYKGKQAEFAKRREYCKFGHEFTPENTYEYRRPDGRVARTCRACHARRQREHAHSVRATTGRRTPRPAGRTAQPARQTVCKRGHRMTPENTYEYTQKSGKIARTCRQCKVLRQRAYEQRHGITSHH
ncbi:hypothetical protein BIV57_02055 [Mangrovactinospora gilvigrisea]|uniref:Uncharacterized protein n=1 Tax=Mangrovactinospora gilvigrisea TaxID=1428644 RepID=A0A1J7C085_9ACTN|nr:hypothetical protein BIV57_02055 [Mangrovactinospora gilvigrisea]